MPSRGRLLPALENLGFVFVFESANAVFGDKSCSVRPSLTGEDFMDETDGL